MSRNSSAGSERLWLLAVAGSVVAGCCPRTVRRPAVDRLWFVIVGDVEAKPPNAAGVLPVLRATIDDALKEDVAVVTTWPTGGTPTQADLDAAGRTGIHIDATITQLSFTTTSYPEGDFMRLYCAVELVLTLIPSERVFLTLPGSAIVTGPATNDTGPVAEECIRGVGEELMRGQLGEAIQTQP